VFGTHDLDAGQHVIAAAPIALWELSLGVYLTVKGFKPAAVAALTPTDRDSELSPA